MKRSLRYFEEKSKDLAVRLQHSLQRKGELESVLSDVMATQKKKANQWSSPSKARTEWKLEQSMREEALLKAQLTQLKESFQQLQLERHEYAEHLKGERARWQQRMRKMSQEICTLKKEKQQDMRRVEKLERSLSKLKNQTAEPLPPEPPAVPSEVELQHLRKELERVAGELQAQVKNNQRISLLNRGQEERIQEQEERLRKQEERLQEQHKSLQQLAKPQSVLEELEHLEAASQQNQQLTAQPSLMALPGEGHGGEHLDSEGEEAPQPMPSVPEDLENREAMSSFMDHLEEKADLSELVKKKELRFIHHWRERCHQKIHHLLSEPGGRAKDAALGGGHHQAGAQGGDEGEAAGAAADGIAAYSNYNNGHRKFLAAAHNPADEPGPGAPAPQELGAADKHGDLCEVSLTSSAQGEAREDPLLDKPTAQPIVQDHQEHPGLGSNCCVPFFRWAWLPRRRR
ncbi:putative golgin subfamily A member 8I isoform X2 [Pan troglodytes]|nr:golgin subfamily A member 8S isoform X2 [Pan troglodytes]